MPVRPWSVVFGIFARGQLKILKPYCLIRLRDGSLYSNQYPLTLAPLPRENAPRSPGEKENYLDHAQWYAPVEISLVKFKISEIVMSMAELCKLGEIDMLTWLEFLLRCFL